jgi:DNA polymerase III alpha subunit
MTDTIYNESTGIELLYRNKPLRGVPFDINTVEQFNSACEELDLEKIENVVQWSKDFLIPKYYKDLDVEEYIRARARMEAPDTAARVEHELALYKAMNLYPVLQLMIYIVDTMRKNNIVWGVGRGSSVASYCLYLIGVHKIDSIKYNLNIREFLK